jgi:predicted metal-binding membrane protein
MFSESASIGGRRGRDPPLVALGASVIAWMALIVATTSNTGSQIYNSSMMTRSSVGSIFEFLGAWEIMVIAMMLPSSLGFLTLFRVATSDSRFPIVRRTAVCVGYALVWLGVGWITMVISILPDRVESLGAWLGSHPNLLGGSVFLLAGIFQFTTLKQRCLTICSHPMGFFARHYRRGLGNALALGVRYGLVCVGCCWALMAIMVVAGGSSLYLMIVLTAIMFAERLLGWNKRFVAYVGLACLALGVLLAVSPGIAPVFTQNAEIWVKMGSVQLSHYQIFWCHV